MIEKGIFGFGVNFDERYIPDWDSLKKVVSHARGFGLKIVLTQGTYDLLHLGHMQYLELARSYGDILIVGVDNDEKVRKRKGKDRPVIHETERLKMLTHLRSVTIVTLKPVSAAPRALLELVKPDVLVVSRSTKKNIDEDVLVYKQHAAEVVVLDPQGEMSSSGRIRNLIINGSKTLCDELKKRLPDVVSEAFHSVIGGKGELK